MKNFFLKYKKFDLLFITLLIILSFGFIISGYLYFASYKKEFNTNIAHQLSAVSELKADELMQWRKERLNDAEFFYKNTEFSILSKKYLSTTKDKHLGNRIKLMMTKMYNADLYDAIFLIDKMYKEQIIVSDVKDRMFSFISQQSMDSVSAGKIVFEDFYYNEISNKIYLKILVPVIDENKKNNVIGIVVLRVDPNDYLYPLIQRWPSDSKSGETLLIRREGNDVVYVNQLRFKDNAALKLRFDFVKNKELPAAKALMGATGLTEGIDYRGVEVIADIRAIPGSPWFIISKMDKSEIYASYNERQLIVVLTILLLVLSAGTSVGFIIKQNNLKNFRLQIESAEMLRKSEERFRAIVENTGEGIGFVNPKEQFEFVNRAAEEIFGVASGTLVGMNLNDFVSETQYKVVQKETTQRVQGNKSVYELEIVRPNGEKRMIIITAVPYFEKEKGFIGTYGVFRDITERKKSETDLLKSEEKYRSLYNNTPVMLHSIDSSGVLISVSDFWLATLGYNREEVIGKRSSEFLTKASAKYAAEIVLPEFMKSGFCKNIEYQFVKKNGDIIDTLLSAVSESDKNGKIFRSVAVITDVTERKQTEKALMLTQLSVESASDALFWMKPNGKIINVNDAACRSLGYTREELLRLSVSDVDVHYNAEVWDQHFPELRKRGTLHFESEQRAKDGSTVPVEIVANYIRFGDEEFNCAFARDISERKRTEETLQKKERYQRALLDNFPFAVWLKDNESRFLAVNQLFATTFNALNADELVGKNDFDIAPREDAEAYQADDRSVLASREKKIVEEEIVDQGVRKWFETYKAPVIGSNNELLGTVGFTRDISERKLAQESILQEKKFNQAAIDSLPGLFYLFDEQGHYLRWNKNYEEVSGYSAEEISRMSPLDYFTEPDKSNIATAIQQVWTTGNVIVEGKFTSKNRTQKQYFFTGQLFWFEGKRCLIGMGIDITERKLAEEEILREKNLLRTLIDNLPDKVHLKDSELRYQLNNIVHLRTLGLSKQEESIGKTILDFYPLANIKEQINKEIEVLNSGKSKLEYEEQFFDEEKKELQWYLTSKVPVRDHLNTIVGLLTISRNITDQKKMTDALRTSESRYRMLADNSFDVIWTMDMTGKFTYISPSVKQLRGFTPEEILHQTFEETISPGSQKIVMEKLQNQFSIAGNGRQLPNETVEVEQPCKDGSSVWTEVVARIMYDENEKGIGIIGVSRNIQERKKIEESLKESERKFRTLFENMTEGVALHEVIYDGDKAIDYRIIDINPAYEKHTGLMQTHARGLLASTLYGTGSPPYFDEFVGVAFSGKPIAFETFFAPLNRHFHIGVISPGKGFFATVFEDITERKRAEKELREKNSELERFTYTVSHDLKSPLITIKGFSGGLLKDISLGRHDRFESDLKRINDAADKMSGLLNDLLELSRIGRIVNPPSDIAFDILVNEVVTLLSGSITKRKANVIVQEGLPVVYADRRRLFEVVQNLLENALKFTGEHQEPRIEIGMQYKNNERVFFVRDNGNGIDPRYHETIFGLFNKLDASTEGTGIGLALARRIIEVHGGRIWVESDGTNRGATFYFTLPAIQPQPTRKESTV